MDSTAHWTLESVRARAVRVPLTHPLVTASGLIGVAPLVLVDLMCSHGVVGRSYVFTYSESALAATASLIETLGSRLVGRALQPLELARHLEASLTLLGNTGLCAMAVAALDMAAWDGLARGLSVPLAILLGSTPAPLPCYDSQGLDDVALGTTRVARARDAGFRAIKIKLGYDTLEHDLDVLATLKRVAGPTIRFMVDYNQSLDRPTAARRIRALDSFDLEWVEEPLAHDDDEGHAQLSRSATTPIQIGENWFGTDAMARSLRASACSLCMPDAMKIGGVTGWLAAAALARAHRIPVSSHLFPEISAHLLNATAGAHWLEYMDFASPILSRGLRIEDGLAHPGDEPGSGIDWNEAAVERYRA